MPTFIFLVPKMSSYRQGLTVERHPGQKHIVVIRGRCECIRNVSLHCYANFYFLGAQNIKL